MQHILVVDDDVEITTLLTDYLTRFGYAAYAACNAQTMRAQMAAQPIGLVVLDVMLPGTDGITLARELRERSRVPIIMLTARANPYDCVLGLEMGADDYMGKPFEPRELVARIQIVLRRTRGAEAPVRQGPDEVVRFDGWTLHSLERHLVSPGGMVVPLSNAEFRLLCTFLRMPRRVFSRDQLMEQARGRAMDAFERSIDLLVSRLRSKPGYYAFKKRYRQVLESSQTGQKLYSVSHDVKTALKKSLLPGSTLFENMGFTYMGPVDGHDVVQLTRMLREAKDLRCPVLLHVHTVKGQGYGPAEADPGRFHGIGPFDVRTGSGKPAAPSFSSVFGETLTRLAGEDRRICALTARREGFSPSSDVQNTVPTLWRPLPPQC